MSQNTPIEVDVDGTKYVFYRFDPFVASDLFNDLVQVLAPALSGGLGALLTASGEGGATAILDGESPDGTKLDPQAITAGLADTIHKFDKKFQRELMTKIADKCHVEREPGKSVALKPIFSAHFQGRTLHMYKWLVAGVKAQFDDFLSEWGGAISRLGQLLPKE